MDMGTVLAELPRILRVAFLSGKMCRDPFSLDIMKVRIGGAAFNANATYDRPCGNLGQPRVANPYLEQTLNPIGVRYFVEEQL
jgi:hypothetical protein